MPKGDDIMATKGIEVIECSVVDGVFYGRVAVKAGIKTGQEKDAVGLKVKYTFIIKDPIADVLEKAATTWRIDLAKIRDKGIEAIQGLDGAEIHVSDIPEMTSNAGGARQVNVDKMSDEQALALLERLQAKLEKSTKSE